MVQVYSNSEPSKGAINSKVLLYYSMRLCLGAVTCPINVSNFLAFCVLQAMYTTLIAGNMLTLLGLFTFSVVKYSENNSQIR